MPMLRKETDEIALLKLQIKELKEFSKDLRSRMNKALKMEGVDGKSGPSFSRAMKQQLLGTDIFSSNKMINKLARTITHEAVKQSGIVNSFGKRK